ncbi:MAG: type I restriction endonuclease subunit R [Chloroflexota bacterium]|nr:type I restriction endonuclease subunit R [Chloroflexota bacterium]
MTTPSKLNEFNHAEAPAGRLLERLGWAYVPREELAAERGGEREVLLKGRLRSALLRLNEWMTEAQSDRVIFDLEHIDATGMGRNQAVHEYLTYGRPLTVDGPQGRDSRTVRFFDFDHPEGGLNEYVVTTQFRVRRANERGGAEDDERMVIPDIVLFVNGIPLVVMEAKSPSLMDVWKTNAVRQLRRYQEAGPEWRGSGAPELFHYNLLCVAHCGAAAAYASIGAPENAYFEWKWLGSHSEDDVRQRYGVEPQGQAQLIAGLLSPATLLDILRDYVVYEPERGRLVKKLPRYQQYRTVRAGLERLLTGLKPEERGGVVWHTQGSGKSLTMLWLATKLRREPRLGNPTIVVVTDRTQLDRQITGTFERCGFPAPERAATSRDLRRLLTTGAGRTIMTTIQKFEEALTTPEGELDVLNASENVIVMVDEAHRTQYGILGGRLSKALPNAALIGFTGTPIEKGFKRNTIGRFGSLIDTYTIPQSVADGATVPIFYEARLPELAIEGPETLDKLYDAMFGDEPPAVQAQIRRRYANKETVAEAERRIEMIALDIAEHFKAKVRPNGFKAQVVAPSRVAALRYASRLRDFGLSAYPIITTAPNDGPEFKAARELDQGQVESAFVDPEGEPEVLVVVDMLLTGFDAPVEQVLYLDRALREHALLQAVARVNRRFSHRKDGAETEKTHGLVVDYHGVSRDLEDVLSTFDWSDVHDTMQELDEDPASVVEAAAVQAESHFKGRNLNDTWACVSVFAPDASTEGNFKADLFERFNADYSRFSRLMDRFLPDPRALDYTDRLARLTEIRAYVRAQFLREDADIDWTEIGAKVKKLVDERISAQVREMMRPVSILDQDFDQKIAALPHDEARASIMEHAIRSQIHESLGDNPAFYERLSEQLARIIDDLRNRVIDAAEACRRYAEVRGRMRSEADIAAEFGLSPTSFAIYALLERRPENGEVPPRHIAEEQGVYHVQIDEEARNVALRIESVVAQRSRVVDWHVNEDVRRLMRRDIKRELRPKGDYAEDQLEELASRIVELASRRSGQ